MHSPERRGRELILNLLELFWAAILLWCPTEKYLISNFNIQERHFVWPGLAKEPLAVAYGSSANTSVIQVGILRLITLRMCYSSVNSHLPSASESCWPGANCRWWAKFLCSVSSCNFRLSFRPCCIARAGSNRTEVTVGSSFTFFFFPFLFSLSAIAMRTLLLKGLVRIESCTFSFQTFW